MPYGGNYDETFPGIYEKTDPDFHLENSEQKIEYCVLCVYYRGVEMSEEPCCSCRNIDATGSNKKSYFVKNPDLHNKTPNDLRSLVGLPPIHNNQNPSGLVDSGNRTEFPSGAVRDMGGDKGRCDLLPASALLRMLQCHDIPFSVSTTDNGSICHVIFQYLLQYLNGDNERDYLADAARLLFVLMEREANSKFDDTCVDNIYPNATIRLSKHYEKGAKKYSSRNWEKGINISSFIDSGIRHLLKYTAHQTDEDHLVAATWNIVGAMWTEQHHPDLQDIPSRKLSFSENKEDEIIKNCETCKYTELLIYEYPCETCCRVRHNRHYCWEPKEND